MSIQTIAVIGSGLMGRGIAQVSALGGFRTFMVDVADEILQAALRNIREEMDKGIAIGKLSAEQRDLALARLSSEKDLERGVREADLVIEAVPEDMRIKIETF